MYSFTCNFSKLEHIAPYNAKNQNTVKTNFRSHARISALGSQRRGTLISASAVSHRGWHGRNTRITRSGSRGINMMTAAAPSARMKKYFWHLLDPVWHCAPSRTMERSRLIRPNIQCLWYDCNGIVRFRATQVKAARLPAAALPCLHATRNVNMIGICPN